MSGRSRFTVVDLFCGAGGLSEGLQQAGFDTRVGVDFDKNAIATFRLNHPAAASILGNVEDVTGDQLTRLAGTKIDLIAGGPSCQGFSTHGKRMQDDPRNFLFKHFVRLVDEIRPRMFLMENVRGMLTYSNGAFRSQIEAAFEEIGYRTAFTTVCAADFGVPQLRHRVLFIGTPHEADIDLSFPAPTHGDVAAGLLPYVTVEEAIGDLPLMLGEYRRVAWNYSKAPSTPFQIYARSGAPARVTLHHSGPLSVLASRLAGYIRPGQGLRAVPLSALPDRFKRMRRISNGQLRQDCTTLYHRLDPSKPAYTITCYYRNVSSGPFLHPIEDRSLSHREAARLMSFPDSYQFGGSNFTRQIGNSVPPLMARAIGKHLLTLLSGEASEALAQVA